MKKLVILAFVFLNGIDAHSQARRSVMEGLAASNNTIFIDTANARVGIGTSTPTSSLDVKGNFSVGITTGQYLHGNLMLGTTGVIAGKFLGGVVDGSADFPMYYATGGHPGLALDGDLQSQVFFGDRGGGLDAKVAVMVWNSPYLSFWPFKDNGDSNTLWQIWNATSRYQGFNLCPTCVPAYGFHHSSGTLYMDGNMAQAIQVAVGSTTLQYLDVRGSSVFGSSTTFSGRVISSYTVAASGLFVGSTGALLYSVGVTSITRTGIGLYMVNLSTPFINSGYVVDVGPESDTLAAIDCALGTNGNTANMSVRRAEAFPVVCYHTVTGGYLDPGNVHFMVAGPSQ